MKIALPHFNLKNWDKSIKLQNHQYLTADKPPNLTQHLKGPLQPVLAWECIDAEALG